MIKNDDEYYLNVRELMETHDIPLPRPKLKIISVPSGEDPT